MTDKPKDSDGDWQPRSGRLANRWDEAVGERRNVT